MARPSIKTQELLDTLCQRLMDGMSLREACSYEDMPDVSTIKRWLANDPAFCAQYARACEVRADHWADEILEIADDGTNDWVERQQDGRTVTVIDHEHISRSKLRVDARKWLMAKANPKKYGDYSRQDINVTRTASELTDAELSDIAAGSSAGTVEAPGGEEKPSRVH